MYRTSTLLVLSLLSFSTFAITPGPERPVSGVVYAPPAGEQRPGAVASDGTDFLAIWSDQQVPHQGVYAARVTTQANVTVAAQRLVRSGAARDLSLCYAGDGYLATWTDDATQSVFSAKLSRDGSLVAGPRLIVAAEQHDAFTTAAGTYPRALACTTTAALLVAKVGTTPMVEMLDASGNLTKSGGALPISDGDPIVTVNVGSNFYVATEARATGTLGIIRVGADGSIADAAPVPIISGFNAVQIGMAYNNNRLAVAAVSSTMLKRAFVDAGTLAVTNLPDVASGGQDVSVVSNGSFFDAYIRPLRSGKMDVMHVTFRDNETSAPTPDTALHTDFLGTSLMVASNGRDNLAIWKDFRRSSPTAPTDGDVYGAFLGAGGGANTNPFAVATTAEWENPVAIASSGSESLVVWNERTGDANQAALMAMRVDPKGALLDAAPRQIASPVLATAPPAATWDGSTYIVAWTESRSSNFGDSTAVVTQRVGRDGAPTGSTTPYDGAFSPALGSNGSSALLVFTYPDGRGSNFVLMQGNSTSSVTPMGVYGYSMSIGASGSDYLVAWTEGIETCTLVCFPDKRDINAVRISGSGTMLDSTPIAIATGPKDQAFPHVSSDGTNYVIVYTSWDNIWSLDSKRVTKNGELVGSTPTQDGIVLATDVAPSSSIARDDASYVVAYDAGSGPDTTALRLLRLNDSGAVIEQSGSLGAATRSVPASPAVVKVPGGPIDIAYSRYAQETQFGGTMRAFVRLTPDASAPVPGKSRGVRH